MANGRTISPWYAIEHLGNTRLAATIFTLKMVIIYHLKRLKVKINSVTRLAIQFIN
jgi:hypothetical protein